MTSRLKSVLLHLPAHGLAVFALVVMLAPLAWMVSTSLKPPTEVFSGAFNLVPAHPTLENYQIALTKVPLLRYLLNSLVMAGAVTAGQLFTGTLAAYAFARYRFRGQELLLVLFLATMAIPVQVLMIPNYVLVVDLGWINTFQGLIAPQLVAFLPVFLLRQQFRAFPTPLIEAAALDGANSWQTLWKVVIPPSAPALIAVGVTIFLWSWNSYLWPLLVATDREMRVVQLGVQQFAAQEGGTSWGPLMAAATVATIVPLLAFLVMQRRIMESFVHAGVK